MNGETDRRDDQQESKDTSIAERAIWLYQGRMGGSLSRSSSSSEYIYQPPRVQAHKQTVNTGRKVRIQQMVTLLLVVMLCWRLGECDEYAIDRALRRSVKIIISYHTSSSQS